jgi:hypothetical protein
MHRWSVFATAVEVVRGVHPTLAEVGGGLAIQHMHDCKTSAVFLPRRGGLPFILYRYPPCFVAILMRVEVSIAIFDSSVPTKNISAGYIGAIFGRSGARFGSWHRPISIVQGSKGSITSRLLLKGESTTLLSANEVAEWASHSPETPTEVGVSIS